MRLLTPLHAVILAVAFGSQTAHAQDSPIYLNDNGGIPLETQGKDGKKSASTPPPGGPETHIQYKGNNKIKSSGDGTYYIKETGAKATCLELPDGARINLADKAPWALITVSTKDNLVISSNGADNTKVIISPSPNTKLRDSTDVDDVDPKGGDTQLIGGIFRSRDTSEWYGYYSPARPFVVHYCGPANNCQDQNKVEQCPTALSLKKK